MKLTKNIQIIIEEILNGEVVVIPTDTVLGLFCLKDNSEGIQKIYEMKNRAQSKKMGIYSANLDFINTNKGLIGMSYIFNDVIYRSSTIHQTLDKIVKKTGDLYGTSCNISGEIPIVNPQHVPYDIWVFDQPSTYCIESSILNLDNNTIIRHGMVQLSETPFVSIYKTKISSDLPYFLGYSCKDLMKNFWFFVREHASINFKIECRCYTCHLINLYIKNLVSVNE